LSFLVRNGVLRPASVLIKTPPDLCGYGTEIRSASTELLTGKSPNTSNKSLRRRTTNTKTSKSNYRQAESRKERVLNRSWNDGFLFKKLFKGSSQKGEKS